MKLLHRTFCVWVLLVGTIACGKGSSPTSPTPPSTASLSTVIVILHGGNSPLAGIKVKLSAGTALAMSANTDASGQATIPNVPQGTYQLQVSAPGYRDVNEPLPVQNDVVKVDKTLVNADSAPFLKMTDDSGKELPSGFTIPEYPFRLHIIGSISSSNPPASGIWSITVQLQVGSLVVALDDPTGISTYPPVTQQQWEKVYTITGRPFTWTEDGSGQRLNPVYYSQTDTVAVALPNTPKILYPFVLNFP